MKTTETRKAEETADRRRGAMNAHRVEPEQSLLELQRQAGNQAVASLLEGTHGMPGAAVWLQRQPATAVHGPATGKATAGKIEQLEQGQAESAIANEIERYVTATAQGHRQGFAMFEDWFRARERAKEESSQATMAKICKFIFGKGLEIIFPEEEAFYQTLKKIAEVAFEKALDKLGEASPADIAGFFAQLKATEEAAITDLLDVRTKFMEEHPDVIQQAEKEFIIARSQGWPSVEELPPQVLVILRKAGIGIHGAAAATVFAARWLTAHIQSIYEQDPSVLAGGPGRIDVQAKIAALVELQKTSGLDLREAIFALEQQLPLYFRGMVDINHAHYLLIGIKLRLREEKAQAIAQSREVDGPFKDTDELVDRGILTHEEYEPRRVRMVVH